MSSWTREAGQRRVQPRLEGDATSARGKCTIDGPAKWLDQVRPARPKSHLDSNGEHVAPDDVVIVRREIS